MDESLRKSSSDEFESKLYKYDNQIDVIKEVDDAISRVEENRSEINFNYEGKNTQVDLLRTTQGIPKEEEGGEEEVHKRESNISRILSDDTIKRIIVIILIIMVSIPAMDINNYVNISTQWDFMVAFTAKML